MTPIDAPSPNQSARPAGTTVSCVVLHADAAPNAQQSIGWISNPDSKVSYHVIIDRNGDIYSLVPPTRKAWHAGVSTFMGVPNCNNYSVGVCFANKNDGKEPFTGEQYTAGATYVAGLMRTFPAITLDRITTHALVARPLGRKTDPLKFDFPQFLKMVEDER
jgi:AmpD protein